MEFTFTVENHIYDKSNLAWRDNAVKMVYVIWKAVVDNYYIVKDNDVFDVLWSIPIKFWYFHKVFILFDTQHDL